MITHPQNAMPLPYLEGTWFHTWLGPGLALAFFVGFCPLVVAGATWRHMEIAKIGHVVVGLGLISWVALEVAWVVVSPPLQLAATALGVTIFALGIHDLRLDPK